MLTEDEIIQQVTLKNEESDEEEEETGEVPSNIPTNAEVADMLHKCLLWYERQAATATLLLKKIRDLAASKRYSNLKQLKQLKLQSFFK